MGKAATGLQVAKHLSGYLSTGERLIWDPQFQCIKQSLAWTILATAGMVNSTNVITDPVHWSSFQVLFQKYVEEGDYMDEVDCTTLDTEMKELQAHVVQHTMDTIHPGCAFHAVWMHEVSRPTADKVGHCFLAPIWFHGSNEYSSAALLIQSARIFSITFARVFLSAIGC